MSQARDAAFQRAIALDDLEVGGATAVQLGGEPICLIRISADEVRAVHDICSHAQYELHEGWVDLDEATPHIECALHGSSFSLTTGHPDALPAVKPIPTYAVRIEDGDVLVDATTPTNDAPVPRH